MIEILTERLAAGELKTFMVQGEYIEILEATYPLDVFLMDRSGGQISTMRQAEASFFSRPGQFEVFQVQSAQAQTIRVFVGSGDAGTRRAAGVVQVVDGGRARTLANNAFVAYGNPGSSAGNLPTNQLWNPPGSGRLVFVKRVIVGSSSNNQIGLRRHNAALPTLGPFPVQSKYLGGAVSTLCEIRNQSAAAAVGTFMGINWQLLANTSALVTLEEPIAIPPGQGLVTQGGTSGTDCTTTFEFFEEAM